MKQHVIESDQRASAITSTNQHPPIERLGEVQSSNSIRANYFYMIGITIFK